MRYRIYLECFYFCVWLWVVCVAFYLSFIWLFVWSIIFPLICVFPWDVIFILSSFRLISVYCPTINKHISGFFRILGSRRSVWGKSSYISFLRIPCSFIYRIVQYICYVWVWFVDLIYALLNSFGICWLCFGLCAVRFIFYSSFLLIVGEKSVISFSGLFMWSRLLWQEFLSISLDFSGFSEAREVYEEVLLI